MYAANERTTSQHQKNSVHQITENQKLLSPQILPLTHSEGCAANPDLETNSSIDQNRDSFDLNGINMNQEAFFLSLLHSWEHPSFHDV